jgi:hypothetical protein
MRKIDLLLRRRNIPIMVQQIDAGFVLLKVGVARSSRARLYAVSAVRNAWMALYSASDT